MSFINRDDTTMYVDWPKSFSSNGKYGLYIYEGDIFILDINTANFLRVTNTPIKEKSARFSPDGKNIAFIRENDLFTYNIKKKHEKRLTYNGSETTLNGTVPGFIGKRFLEDKISVTGGLMTQKR